jgi:hypothetical protein
MNFILVLFTAIIIPKKFYQAISFFRGSQNEEKLSFHSTAMFIAIFTGPYSELIKSTFLTPYFFKIHFNIILPPMGARGNVVG